MKIPKRWKAWDCAEPNISDRAEHFFSLDTLNLFQALYMAVGLIPESYDGFGYFWLDDHLLVRRYQKSNGDEAGDDVDQIYEWIKDAEEQWIATGKSSSDRVKFRDFIAWVSEKYEKPHWIEWALSKGFSVQYHHSKENKSIDSKPEETTVTGRKVLNKVVLPDDKSFSVEKVLTAISEVAHPILRSTENWLAISFKTSAVQGLIPLTRDDAKLLIEIFKKVVKLSLICSNKDKQEYQLMGKIDSVSIEYLACEAEIKCWSKTWQPLIDCRPYPRFVDKLIEQDRCVHFKELSIRVADGRIKAHDYFHLPIKDGLRSHDTLQLGTKFLDRAGVTVYLNEIGLEVTYEASPPAAITEVMPSTAIFEHEQLIKPLQRQAANEKNILKTINNLGFDPRNLPSLKKAITDSHKKAGSHVKGLVRTKLVPNAMTQKAFTHAWGKLSANGEIDEARLS